MQITRVIYVDKPITKRTTSTDNTVEWLFLAGHYFHTDGP